jgi:DNA-cytosine methyltransferase
MIKYFEAFAGIGAFRSAFEKVGGFECVGWCEIDRFAQKAYRTLYDTKGEIFYEDITKIDYGNMPDFDLLVGGPCCQSFSVAGRRLAFEDDRGNLFFNYIQILEAKRPRYFIAENVPNLLGISQGECFRIILEKISELGYSMCWRVLNSAGFGIPQFRNLFKDDSETFPLRYTKQVGYVFSDKVTGALGFKDLDIVKKQVSSIVLKSESAPRDTERLAARASNEQIKIRHISVIDFCDVLIKNFPLCVIQRSVGFLCESVNFTPSDALKPAYFFKSRTERSYSCKRFEIFYHLSPFLSFL